MAAALADAPAVAAKALSASAVLAGSVRRIDGKLRVTARSGRGVC